MEAKDLLDSAMEKQARRALRDWVQQELGDTVRVEARELAERWVKSNKSLISEEIEKQMLLAVPKIARSITRGFTSNY